MNALYVIEIKLIEFLQNRLIFHQDLLIKISEYLDPTFAYYLYIPLVFSFDFKCGRKLMWTIILVEWSNHLLKWLLHGERPYWWIHETLFFEMEEIPTPVLRQFHITCETGPGCPSGHCESAAAVWYVIINRLLKTFNFPKKDGWENFILKVVGWSIYVCILCTVAISRIFVISHFFHQCLLGVALGLLLAIFIEKYTTLEFNLQQYCQITMGQLLSGLLIYCLLKLFGSDPMWSLDRAAKWCAKPENIHMNSAPVYAMMRYAGYTLGIGFGFNSSNFSYHSQREFEMPKKIICAILSVSICRLPKYLSFRSENLLFYLYFQEFCTTAIFAYIVVAIIPSIATKLWLLKEKLD